MRKNTKQGLLDLIKTIYDAHDEIKKFIKNAETENAGNLLGDCQDAVISIGEKIQSSEGEDFVTIGIIEKYCHDLFDVYNSLNKDVDWDGVYKLLNRDLTNIKKSIEKDIIGKIEVVFLPYKASMWDSLESVWKAADEDPECDAYVVPIPYYDRNPDHSFGEFHYEGGEYPDYVPVTHYNNYDISKRRPDVIYIHNPYDDCNYVTSVDPRFYSRELKKYTDKLVYIPYFVLGEINPDDENALERIAHFVLPPGVINADKVIVQSEDMKKAYVNILLKNFGDTEENRKMFEQKIWGTGSPKFDKIANMSKDDVDIPDEWKRIIYKPDGSRKKVVFYNNSVGALLENDEKMLEKMRSVFNTFFEYKDEVALLWRPHPLIKATIKSMRSSLWEDYSKIVDKYVSDEWGIYDDTPDLDRAVALSDAYYGDPSSVVQLCETTGKKILIQCPEIKNSNLERRVRFIDCLDEEDSIWFVGLHTNCLFCFNKKDQETRLVSFLDSYLLDETYRWIGRVNNKLYMLPVYSERIIVYDIDDKTLENISLSDDFFPSGKLPLFVKGVVNRDCIYCLPMCYGALVKLDIKTGTVKYFVDYAEKIKSIYNNECVTSLCNYFIDGEKIYMGSSEINSVVVFDMNTDTSDVMVIGKEGNGYSAICVNDSFVYLVDKCGDTLIIFDIVNGNTQKIKLESSSKYNYLFSYNNGIYRIPCRGETTAEVISKCGGLSFTTFEIKADNSIVGKIYPDNDSVMSAYLKNDRICIYSSKSDSLCIYDTDGKVTSEYIFEPNDEDKAVLLEIYRKQSAVFWEKNKSVPVFYENTIHTNLDSFLKYLLYSEKR